MKTMLKSLVLAVAAMAMGAMAETTVTVTKFHQSYPYSGKATVEYTVGGALPANAVAEFTINTDDASATFVQSNIVAGANSHVIDFASSFGGALLLTNASFVVTITEDLGGVQLWEGGPYWAECNVGAEKPEDYGYYFWWGDTVGYTRSGGTWNSTSLYYSDVRWVSSTGQQVDGSPFTSSCPTYSKSNSQLQSAGYIDATGNLVAAHDAATAHLGAPWRMPTSNDIDALIEKCTTTWITTNGVNGRLVTGKGSYSDRSIFLPAGGHGYDSYFNYPGSRGYIWSSTPNSETSLFAQGLFFITSDIFRLDSKLYRFNGQSVRPVRGFAERSAAGVVTYDAPIVITSAADWNALSAAVAHGAPTEGTTVRLACDVGPVTAMVGTSEHPFAGVFNGGSNTLTVALSGTTECIAPFSRISGATIRDLKVAGTVAGAMHCSGLVGGVNGAPNLIEGCEVAAAITTSGTHCGGFVGHGGGANAASAFATTLRGCVFSGSIVGGTAVGTLWGWGDTYAVPTLENCLDASASAHPIGRSFSDATVSNVLHVADKATGGSRPFPEGKRGAKAFAVSPGEGVVLDFGEPLLTYGGSDLAVHPAGLAYGGTFYAASGESVALSPVFTGTPPAGMKHDGFVASAGDLAKSGDAWVLTMPAGAVVISATFATAYEIWAAANGVSGAWDETDALGVHNVFRYVFDVPTGAITNPPLIDIEIEGGNAVVITPPVSNTVGFAVSVVESSDIAGKTVTRRRSLNAAGRAVFAMEGADSRFYRLAASDDLGGVQLWEGGPYWAECNVGAAAPEEYGYYFWWGDTVGYTNTGSGWISVKDGTSISFTDSGTAASTYGKSNSALQSAGYIDSTGNLVAAYDAATAHLGAPWRMPTDAEFVALTNNCTAVWTTQNGVTGRLVTGKGAYADRSIFLPAAGLGYDSYLYYTGSSGYCWSSTPMSGNASGNAWCLDFSSRGIGWDFIRRCLGQSVRPVRDGD